MHILPDGSVIPSEFSISQQPKNGEHQFSNVALRVGKIVKIYYPKDSNNISKKFIEYDVRAAQSKSGSGANLIVYRNCRLNNVFGASNNFLTHTLHPSVLEKGVYKKGANVIFMCIDGIVSTGCIILGAVESENQLKIYDEQDGQFYDFNFNGINYNINKDGEWTVTFNSVIDPDGKKANEAASGTQIKIDKEGRVKISDNEGQYWEIDRVAKKSTWTDGAESIIIDKANKKISLASSGDLSSASKDNTAVSADKQMSLKSKEDMNFSSDTNMLSDAKGNMNLKSGGNLMVNSSGSTMMKSGDTTIIQAANVAQIMGTTMTRIGAGTVPAGAVGISQSVGVDSHGTPVVSLLISGSSTVFVGT